MVPSCFLLPVGAATVGQFADVLRKSRADILLRSVAADPGLDPSTLSLQEAYLKQLEFRSRITVHHRGSAPLPHFSGSIGQSTFGTVIERFAECGLMMSLEDGSYHQPGNNDRWIGDFVIPGDPIAAVISCKAMKAKERLLVSGLGTNYVPTIGFGWFDAPAEFGANRCKSFVARGFVAIYMPPDTLSRVPVESRNVRNINNIPLLRSVLEMPTDLQQATHRSRKQRKLIRIREL